MTKSVHLHAFRHSDFNFRQSDFIFVNLVLYVFDGDWQVDALIEDAQPL